MVRCSHENSRGKREVRKIAWSGKWNRVLVILIVAVPMILLGASRLMGTPGIGTITVEPVSWQMYRPKLDPYDTHHINETIKNRYSDDYTSTEVSVYIMDYVEDWSWIPFVYKDGIVFKVNVTATVVEGVDASFAIKFRTLDDYSIVEVSGPDQFLVLRNATVTEMRLVSREWTSDGWHNLGEAYVHAESTGSFCSLRTQVEWMFNDQNIEDHKLEVSLEFTYFNQTTSQKIVMPIALDVPIST